MSYIWPYLDLMVNQDTLLFTPVSQMCIWFWREGHWSLEHKLILTDDVTVWR